MKRAKAPRKNHPNPLFDQWLKEWREQAKTKDNKYLVHSLTKALESLKQYPVPLQSGRECGILKHFGKKMCLMLDKKLEEYKAQNPTGDVALPGTSGLNRQQPTSPPARPRARKNPQPPQSTSGTSTSSNGQGTSNGQASKKTVSKKNNNSQDSDSESSNATEVERPIHIRAGTVVVTLLVDTAETSNATRFKSQEEAKKKLEKLGVKHEFRKLSVGDFLWVASTSDGTDELVLPYIVERKRSDDLAKSIKDKRYHEQKMRLHASGLNVIYLIEVTQSNHLSIKFDSLLQAEVNTEIHDKFCIHRTTGIADTISYLATMTRVLQNKFKYKSLRNVNREQGPVYSLKESNLFLCTFKEFNESSSKLENFTVREMFAQHLLQISGISTDAVLALVQVFETPAKLQQEFAKCATQDEGIELITRVKFDTLRRSLPPEVARKIWLFYTTENFSSL
ncbi:hypothetical protein B566_EDAN003011 [Ephemera danica]|nr:hypothetical protein B566_EDAN003011 [Ephemera danica]